MNSSGGKRPLEGKTAVVTGGAVRIGKAIVLELARAGARVAVHYHSSKQEAMRTAREAGGGADVFAADISSVEQAGGLISQVHEVFGGADILVNNAAVFGRTPFLETTEEEWDRFHSTNLKGLFFLTQAFASKSDQGVVINIADSAGEAMWPGYLAYSTTKAGVIALTRGLAKSLAPGIRVNAILPGPMLPPEGSGDLESIAEGVGRTVLKRQGSPEDIARAVLYFVTDGGYVTGAVLPVDGGRHLTG